MATLKTLWNSNRRYDHKCIWTFLKYSKWELNNQGICYKKSVQLSAIYAKSKSLIVAIVFPLPLRWRGIHQRLHIRPPLCKNDAPSLSYIPSPCYRQSSHVYVGIPKWLAFHLKFLTLDAIHDHGPIVLSAMEKNSYLYLQQLLDACGCLTPELWLLWLKN